MQTASQTIADQIEALRTKAETGAQWAEICRLEAEMLAAADYRYPAQDEFSDRGE